jgi:hydroxyacylglutathione hydrolase
MWDSLQKIAALPDDTLVYCGHEYTLANGRFALGVEPDNIDLQERVAAVRTLRAANMPTIPVRLGLEKKTNPFLRAGNAARFAALRLAKDNA